MTKRNIAVLVIDDTTNYGEVLVEELRGRAFKADLLRSSNLPRMQRAIYDYALIHEHLEGDNGIEVARRLLSENRQLRTVVYTANPDYPDARKRAFEAGVFRYVERHVDPTEFADFARELATSVDRLQAITRELSGEELIWGLNNIVAKLGTGIVIVDTLCYIVYANESAIKISDKFRERQRCPFCIPARCGYDRIPSDSATGGSLRELKVLREERRFLDISETPIAYGNEIIGLTLAITDVTERERLLELGRRTGILRHLDERLDYLLGEIQSMGYPRARVFILSPDGRFFIGRRYVGEHPHLTQERFQQLVLPDTEGFTKEMLKNQEAMLCSWKHTPDEDDARRERLLSKLDEKGSFMLKNWMEFPISHVGGLAGMLSVDFGNPEDTCSNADIEKIKPLVEAVGPSIGQSLEIERLSNELNTNMKLRELEGTMLGKTNPRDALMEALYWLINEIKADGGHVRLLAEEWLEMIGGRGPYYNATKRFGIRGFAHIDESGAISKSAEALRVRGIRKGYKQEATFQHYDNFRVSIPDSPEKDALEAIQSYAVYPLIFRGQMIGTLNLESSEPFLFERYEVESLMAHVQKLAAPLLLHMLLEQQATRIASILETVNSIEQLLVGETDVYRAQWLVLTGVTVGFGLGFNRAIYFESEDNGKSFEARMAVGTENSEDYVRFRAISRNGEAIAQELRNLLSDFERDRAAKLNNTVAQKVKGLFLSSDEDVSLKAAVMKRTPVLSEITDSSYQETILPRLRARDVDVPTRYVWSPLVSEGKTIGAIYVDNIYTGKPIYKLDMQYLGIFCNDMAASLFLAKRADLWDSEYVRTGHNLLSPLHTMLLNASTLYEAEVIDEHYRRGIGRILRATQEASVEFRNIIEMYRLRSGHSPVGEIGIHDLGVLVQEALEYYPVVAERKNIGINTDIELGVYVSGVKLELKHMVQVLTSNSISYNDGNNQIIVRIWKDELQHRVFLQVRDKGWGIPEEEQSQIFKQGFRATKARESSERGLGIGLSVVRGIVNRYDGDIKFESEEGVGTTFTVELPLANMEE